MSKYNIKTNVYFMHENKIRHGKIYAIQTDTVSIWAMQLHNDKGNDTERNIRNKYKMVLNAYNKIGTDWIDEKELFETKEDLIKFISKNL